jgi:hypothetical protein
MNNSIGSILLFLPCSFARVHYLRTTDEIVRRHATAGALYFYKNLKQMCQIIVEPQKENS